MTAIGGHATAAPSNPPPADVQLAGYGARIINSKYRGLGGHEPINTSGGGVQRDRHIDWYEEQLKKARGWALRIGTLHAFSRYLAFCSLSWATVVVLGALASSLALARRDLAFVVCLLFLEAGRYASTAFFVRLPLRPLAYLSQDPKKINHGEDGHYSRSRRARTCSYMVRSALFLPSLVMATTGHVCLNYGPQLPQHLQSSLRIFYSLVAFNSLVALLNLTYSVRAFASLSRFAPEQSILRYFDTVLQNATNSQLVQADDFEFFRFAYKMLATEYRRNVQPEAVARNHAQLIKYMYAHRLGVDFLLIFMDAQDAFVQLAAVNMVGFWADATWGVGLGSEMRLPRQLLSKLSDKVGMGQVGWAASTCIGVLACMPRWADTLANTHTSSGISLLDCLAGTVDDSSSRSLSIVRTLVRLYEQLCMKEGKPPRPFDTETKLVPKLGNLSKGAKVHRLRVQAAYLLLMMREEQCDQSAIMAIKPTQDSYWFGSEVRMLELLCEAAGVPLFQYPPDFCIREDLAITPPPWAQKSTSAL